MGLFLNTEKKMDPLQQLSEWAAAGRRFLQVDVGSGVVGKKDRYSCWLYDAETDAEVRVTGTDPKTLSEVVAEALAEILSRTEAL